MTDRTHRPPCTAPPRPGDSDLCPDEALRRVRGFPAPARRAVAVRAARCDWNDNGPVVPKIPSPRPATPCARKGGLS
jgi:hypothetical protein